MQENLLSLLWVSHWVPYCFKTQSREIKPANLGAKNSLKQTGAFSIVFNTLQKPALLVFILGLDFFSLHYFQTHFRFPQIQLQGPRYECSHWGQKSQILLGAGQKGNLLGAENSPIPLLALQQTQKKKFQIKFMSKFTDSRNTLMVFWAKANGSTAAF